MNHSHTLGILTCQAKPPYMEDSFFRKLSTLAAKENILVLVFSPKSLRLREKRVRGYYWAEHSKSWNPIVAPPPELIYDRCFYLSSAHYREYTPFIKRLQRLPNTRFLGYGLAGKWEVYQILSRIPHIRPYLPDTRRVHHVNEVLEYLQKKRDIVIKPIGGSTGKKVIRVQQLHPGWYRLLGRDAKNRPFSAAMSDQQLYSWLRKQLLLSRWIAQPYLHLYTADQKPFDIRVLTQKNGHGEWEVVGKAIRQGNHGGLTSNLHGGGKGFRFAPFIRHHFPDREKVIHQQIDALSQMIPPSLESVHGPLLELGIDIGIDRKGDIWIIEVNSKPGRNLFAMTGEQNVQHQSVQNIIDYACYCLKAKRFEGGGKRKQ
jgi:glutathione synthase/RimK-type ligase-like ATP-grasp enzyme